MNKLLLPALSVFLFIHSADAAPDQAARTAAREKAAEVLLQKAAESKKPAEIAGALFKAAGEFKELKRFDEAVFYLLKIPRVKRMPRHESTCAFRAAAQCRMEQLRTTEAIELYHRACACRSGKWSEAVSCRELGEIYMDLGFFDKAAAVFAQAADDPKLGGERFSSLCGKAAALVRLGRQADAETAFQQAAAMLSPEKRQSNAGGLLYLTEAEVLAGAGKNAPALEACKKALAIPKLNWKLARKVRLLMADIAPGNKAKEKTK